jgi:hypothetical protein
MHESAHNEGRYSMSTRSSVSTRMLNNPAQLGMPVSAAVSRLIYTFGKVVGEDSADIEVSIEQFYSHHGIQLKCEQLEHAGLKYLRFSSLHGTGIAAKNDIPQNTELSYYIGAVGRGSSRCSMQSSWH